MLSWSLAWLIGGSTFCRGSCMDKYSLLFHCSFFFVMPLRNYPDCVKGTAGGGEALCSKAVWLAISLAYPGKPLCIRRATFLPRVSLFSSWLYWRGRGR